MKMALLVDRPKPRFRLRRPQRFFNDLRCIFESVSPSPKPGALTGSKNHCERPRAARPCPGFSWNFAGRAPIPTDDNKRSSVLPEFALPSHGQGGQLSFPGVSKTAAEIRSSNSRLSRRVGSRDAGRSVAESEADRPPRRVRDPHYPYRNYRRAGFDPA